MKHPSWPRHVDELHDALRSWRGREMETGVLVEVIRAFVAAEIRDALNEHEKTLH